MMKQFVETLYDAYGQQFSVDRIYFELQTEHQYLLIFHNARFGRVMALDGIVQTTELDEFIYHEMLTHVPIFAHGHARRVLIIGGGDGGMLREVLRHKDVEHVTLVEIDGEIVTLCREHLPNHHQGAFDDPRTHIVIQDGIEFVKENTETFDVIITDSTDPIGPGEVLFKENYYAACRRRLTAGGLLVTQNGVPFTQMDELTTTARNLSKVFKDWSFYTAAVPTYVGGVMTFAWATDDPKLRMVPLKTLQERFDAAGIKTRYYNPEIHQAAFALPEYVRAAIKRSVT
jgi:spermidine synthase